MTIAKDLTLTTFVTNTSASSSNMNSNFSNTKTKLYEVIDAINSPTVVIVSSSNVITAGVGSLSVASSTTSTVADVAITANSIITLTAASSASAALFAGADGARVSSVSSGVGFTISHAANSSAGTFNYTSINKP